MKCVEIEKYTEDFANDELDFANRQKIENHLKECRECRREFEELQNARRLLKNLPAVYASAQFDRRMMKTFQNYRKKQQKKKARMNFRTTVFANFSISKPAFAFGLLALAVFTGSAFQLGRMSAPNIEIAEKTINQPAKPNEANQVVQIIEKRVEIPVIKIVEVPVYREKLVERVVYKERKAVKSSDKGESRKTDFNFQNTATFIQTDDETFTPINLKDFQPVSEIKINIVKKGEKNEK